MEGDAVVGVTRGTTSGDTGFVASQSSPDGSVDPVIEVVVRRNVGVHTRDGTRLATDLYFPANAGTELQGPFPVVLERTPYGRARQTTVELASQLARKGYVFASQDVRGRFDSAGEFGLYMNDPDEGSDGDDTIRWLVAQLWCDGRVATSGGSFAAANQQGTALSHPPGLRAQVLRDAGTDYYRRALRTHGAFNVGLCLVWVVNQAADSPRALAQPDIAAELQQMQRDLPAYVAQFPLRRGQSPLTLFPVYESLFFRMYETADDTEFWDTPTSRLAGRRDDYPTDVAVLMISGWYAHHVAANFTKLTELTPRLRRPVSLIVGPWVHDPGMLEATTAGDVDFGAAAARFGPCDDLVVAWLDRYLRGSTDDNSDRILPPVTYFRMGTGDGHRTGKGKLFRGGDWQITERWPPVDTRLTKYYLGPGGTLASDAPTGGAGKTHYDYDPRFPSPAIGATNLQEVGHPAVFLAGPHDQRAPTLFLGTTDTRGFLGERADVRVFETTPLTAPLEVTGSVRLTLWCASSARDTDFVGKLIDVYPPSADYPEGYAMLLCEDILRMRYRDDRPIGELIEPGRIYEVQIDLGPTSNLFKVGHRIRLDITSSSFPEYDPNPNTGEPMGRHTHTLVAYQTIYHDTDRPLCLILPVRRIDDGESRTLAAGQIKTKYAFLEETLR